VKVPELVVDERREGEARDAPDPRIMQFALRVIF
jgi:hypothetical protein